MAKTINAPTIDEVVSNLLIRINVLIEDAEPEDIPKLTESIAKLATSMKGNDQFGKPLTEEEKALKMEQEIFANALEGEEIK